MDELQAIFHCLLRVCSGNDLPAGASTMAASLGRALVGPEVKQDGKKIAFFVLTLVKVCREAGKQRMSRGHCIISIIRPRS